MSPRQKVAAAPDAVGWRRSGLEFCGRRSGFGSGSRESPPGSRAAAIAFGSRLKIQ